MEGKKQERFSFLSFKAGQFTTCHPLRCKSQIQIHIFFFACSLVIEKALKVKTSIPMANQKSPSQTSNHVHAAEAI